MHSSQILATQLFIAKKLDAASDAYYAWDTPSHAYYVWDGTPHALLWDACQICWYRLVAGMPRVVPRETHAPHALLRVGC